MEQTHCMQGVCMHVSQNGTNHSIYFIMCLTINQVFMYNNNSNDKQTNKQKKDILNE